MRRIHILVFVSLLPWVISTETASAQAVDNEGRQLIEAPFTATPPKIDGEMSPGEWSGAGTNTVDFIKLGVAGNGGPGVADDANDISYTFYVMYDNTYLYIGVSVKDDIYVSTNYGRNLQYDMPVTWEDDAVEYFFDGDLSRTTESCRNETETATGGQWLMALGDEKSPLPFVAAVIYGNHERPFGSGADDSWYAVTKINSNKHDWSQEARFRLDILGSPAAGKEIGFDIAVDDIDIIDDQTLEPDYVLTEGRDIQLYWCSFPHEVGEIATENTHELESMWGTLRFLKPTVISDWSLF